MMMHENMEDDFLDLDEKIASYIGELVIIETSVYSEASIINLFFIIIEWLLSRKE